MKKGTIKFYNELKGFGFIIDSETNKEVFFHLSGLKESVQKDDTVEFDVIEGKKGLNAVNVKKI